MKLCHAQLEQPPTGVTSDMVVADQLIAATMQAINRQQAGKHASDDCKRQCTQTSQACTCSEGCRQVLPARHHSPMLRSRLRTCHMLGSPPLLRHLLTTCHFLATCCCSLLAAACSSTC